MSSYDSTDIRVGQVWERRSDGTQAVVERHPAPHMANPLVGIVAERRSNIRADGLRSRYRLWRDVPEWCHCGEPVDTSEYRNRGMCTHCDDTRCDAYPGECGR